MDLEKPRFAGHETFTVRYSWPKKAVDAVTRDGAVFTADDAMVRFGVGKNMVLSMRHWALVFGLVEEDDAVVDNRGRSLKPTFTGEVVFGANGFDPFLEDPATLWLLHWQIAARPEAATTWWWMFNHYPGAQFSKRDVQNHLETLVQQNNWNRISPASLKRDIDVFVRTYTTGHPHHAEEDVLDCPLVELGLIRETEQQTFEFTRGLHPSLPLEVFAFGLVHFLGGAIPSRSVPLEEIAFAPGSPGRVFCLSEAGLLRRLEQLDRVSRGAITFDETAGLKQVFVHRKLSADSLLKNYYTATSTGNPKWRKH